MFVSGSHVGLRRLTKKQRQACGTLKSGPPVCSTLLSVSHYHGDDVIVTLEAMLYNTYHASLT